MMICQELLMENSFLHPTQMYFLYGQFSLVILEPAAAPAEGLNIAPKAPTMPPNMNAPIRSPLFMQTVLREPQCVHFAICFLLELL